MMRIPSIMVRLVIAAVVIASTLCRADPDRALRDIELALRAMERAVAAGDRDEYLQHVWTGDAVFLAEQRHWADDLKAHVPESFSLTLDAESATFADGWVYAPLTMTWKMEGGHQRSIAYEVMFAEQDGSWRYAGERWNVLKGEGVEVRFVNGFDEIGQRVADVFPEVRAHVEEGFELTIDRVQQVKIYPSMTHLQASIYLSYVDPLSGWNEPGESIKVLLGWRGGGAGLKMLLAHEFGHVCTFEMGDQATKMPWWVAEGVAELAAEAFSGGAAALDRTMRNWARNGRLADWELMHDFRTTPRNVQMNVYRQGHHMMAYITKRFGRTQRNNWIRALTQGKTLDEASREVLGLTFDELDAQWRASLTEVPEPVEAGSH